MEVYRHGDLLLAPVPEIPEAATRLPHLVLARGELSGHAHMVRTSAVAELYEAAQIDGAGRWAQFRHVTWPQLAPTTFFIIVMGLIGGMQGGFEMARVMTGGGPSGTTTTLAYYIYTKCFEEFQVGYASAVAWILFAVIFGLTLITWKQGNRKINF